MNTYDIILAPIITEKSMEGAKSSKFTFKVLMTADKKVIKKQVEEKFDVNVLGVSTMIVKGRKKRMGKKREEIEVGPWKKAVVKLREGQKIGVFDIGEKK